MVVNLTIVVIVSLRHIIALSRSLIGNCVTTVWSNFEIADMDFWRGEAYSKFFDYLDEKGGFYYEVRTNRWTRGSKGGRDLCIHSGGAMHLYIV